MVPMRQEAQYTQARKTPHVLSAEESKRGPVSCARRVLPEGAPRNDGRAQVLCVCICNQQRERKIRRVAGRGVPLSAVPLSRPRAMKSLVEQGRTMAWTEGKPLHCGEMLCRTGKVAALHG